MTSEIDFLGQFHDANLSPWERAVAYDARQSAAADTADAQAERTRQAAAAERIESLTLANYQAGDPLGAVAAVPG